MKTGMSLAAYAVDPNKMVAPIYDRKYGPVFFVRKDQGQKEKDNAANNDTKAKNKQSRRNGRSSRNNQSRTTDLVIYS